MNDSFKNKDQVDFTPRLVLKNIPENLSDEAIKEILNKNFEGKFKDLRICNLEHKYYSKNNKICFVTIDNLETRQKFISFFRKFDIVDPRGLKQKIIVVDALFQNKSKDIEDTITSSFENRKIMNYLVIHFQKFKEYFNEAKLIDFKNEENECIYIFKYLVLANLFDGLNNEQPNKVMKSQESNLTDTKKKYLLLIIRIIIKKNSVEAKPEINTNQITTKTNLEMSDEIKIKSKNLVSNFSQQLDVEVIKIEESQTNYKKKNYYENKASFKKNYGQNDYYNNYQENTYQDNNYQNYYPKQYQSGYQNNGYFDDGYSYDKQNNGNYNNSYNNNNYKKNYKKGSFK